MNPADVLVPGAECLPRTSSGAAVPLTAISERAVVAVVGRHLGRLGSVSAELLWEELDRVDILLPVMVFSDLCIELVLWDEKQISMPEEPSITMTLYRVHIVMFVWWHYYRTKPQAVAVYSYTSYR